jgi:2-hydroxychromene-2-carboxylate isomerase
MTPVTFYVDIACPWTWITARWAMEVAPHRDLDITWAPYSLQLKNEGHLVEPFISRLAAQWPAMRAIACAYTDGDRALVADLYIAFGARIHHDGDLNLDGADEVLANVCAGRDAATHDRLTAAMADDQWDAVLRASTDAGRALVGDDVGIPIIDVGATTFFGPVMSPAPTGDDAVKLWDAYLALNQFDSVFEIKRSRAVGPQMGPRP